MISTAIASLMLVATASPAHGQRLLTCSSRGFQDGQPLVSKPETAKAIFLAVESDFFPAADRKSYPDLSVIDQGRFWFVARYAADKRLPDGSILGHLGGSGQLSIRIDKCDAQVTKVKLSLFR
jgi:hypothetical protein